MSLTVALTREAPRNDELAQLLRGVCKIREIPLSLTRLRNPTLVAAALSAHPNRGQFATIAITSARSASYVAAALTFAREDVVLAAIGEKSAQALRAEGSLVSTRTLLVPATETAEGLGALIERGPVLALGAAEPRTELVDTLAARHIECNSVEVYKTELVLPEGREKKQLRDADVVVIAAPTAWRAARKVVSDNAQIIVLGPTTAADVRRDHANVHEFAGGEFNTFVLDVVKQLSSK